MDRRIVFIVSILISLLEFSCSTRRVQSTPFDPIVVKTTAIGMQVQTEDYEHIFGEEKPFPQCQASTMINVSKNHYLFAWFAGSYEKNDDVGIWMTHGEPGKWADPSLVAKIRNEPHWNPVLFKAPNGTIYLYFKVGKDTDNWETWVQRSADTGRTWTAATELVPGNKGGRGPDRNQPIILSNGVWLAPASIEHNELYNAFVDRSEDTGKTWIAADTLIIDRKKITGEGIIQPALWESKPGMVHMLLRSSAGWICRSDSRDYGKHWSPVYKTDLPNNNSGIDVTKIHGDTIAVIYNPVVKNHGDRYPMSVAISADNGKTWPVKYDIETGKGETELTYPDILYEDGYLVACYTWNRASIAFWKGKFSLITE
ncbi:MAG: sialidase family protein [Flavitalea sp.]